MMYAAQRPLAMGDVVTPSMRALSRRSALVLLCFVLLAVLLFRHAWAAPTHRNIGFSADPQQFLWFLSWMAFALSHGLNPLISHAVDYPGGANLMWNTSILLPSALLAPITTWLGPVFSYNLLITLALPLSGWCAYLVIRRWTASDLAAAVGGLLYGFSPALMGQAQSHPQVVVALAPPLVLLLLDELLVRQRRRPMWVGMALGIVGAAQLLTGEELLATTGVIAIVAIAVLLLLSRERAWERLRRALPGLICAAITFLVLAGAPLLVQFCGPERVPGVLHYGLPYATDLLNFVVPSGTQQLAPAAARALSSHFIYGPSEQDAYIGLPLLLLLCYIVVRWWSSLLVRWAGLMVLVVSVLSLGRYLEVGGQVIRVPLPWMLFEHLPLMRHVLPCRLMIFSYLGIGILLAFFVDRVAASPSHWRWLGIAIVVLGLAPLTPRLDYTASARNAPAFFQGTALRQIPPGSVALVAPFAGYYKHTFTTAMYWQAIARMRFFMPEGYVFVPHPSGNAGMRPPPSVTQMVLWQIQLGHEAPRLTRRLRHDIYHDLRRWAVQHIIVGPMPYQREMLDFFRRLLHRQPRRDGGVYVWWHIASSYGYILTA